jgi:hypothetical protein
MSSETQCIVVPCLVLEQLHADLFVMQLYKMPRDARNVRCGSSSRPLSINVRNNSRAFIRHNCLRYNPGTRVTLTATPASGSSFGGWAGACAGVWESKRGGGTRLLRTLCKMKCATAFCLGFSHVRVYDSYDCLAIATFSLRRLA